MRQGHGKEDADIPRSSLQWGSSSVGGASRPWSLVLNQQIGLTHLAAHIPASHRAAGAWLSTPRGGLGPSSHALPLPAPPGHPAWELLRGTGATRLLSCPALLPGTLLGAVTGSALAFMTHSSLCPLVVCCRPVWDLGGLPSVGPVEVPVWPCEQMPPALPRPSVVPPITQGVSQELPAYE